MAIFTGSKGLPPDAEGNPGVVFPENATQAAWSRTEPLITPDQLVTRFLIGISLQSRFVDPSTGKKFWVTNDILKDIINQAVAVAEEDSKLVIMPTYFSEKYAFDRNEYESFGYFKLNHRPCFNLASITVNPSNNQDVFVVPLDWVETSYLAWGQLNLIPLTLALVAGGTGVSNTVYASQMGGGAVFMSILGQRPWVPSFWKIEGMYGFKDGMLPLPVNRLIGNIAASDVLSQLAAADARVSSASLGIDGMSQSTSTEGSRKYVQRLKELADDKKVLIKRLRRRYGQGISSGNV